MGGDAILVGGRSEAACESSHRRETGETLRATYVCVIVNDVNLRKMTCLCTCNNHAGVVCTFKYRCVVSQPLTTLVFPTEYTLICSASFMYQIRVAVPDVHLRYCAVHIES